MEGANASSTHSKSEVTSWRRFIPWVVAAVVFAISLPVYYTTAKKRAAIFNTDTSRSSFFDSTDTKKVKAHVVFHHDQHVYMNLGRLLKRHNYDHFVPRQRTPGFPLILSLFYDAGDEYQATSADDPRHISDAMFARCREFNIILSMVLLVAIFFFSIKTLGIYGSLLATWICGWTLFLFKCIFVQPELLFYTLFLMSFVLLWRQVIKPTWTRGIIAGVLVAAAYFIKSAIPPLLLLFVVCFALRRFIELGKTLKTPEFSWKEWFLNVGKGAVIPVLWLALLSPYFAQTAKVYSNPFWSVHTKHLMWQEDASTKKKWRILSDPKTEIPADAPSFSKYWADHKNDLAHFIARPIEGASNTLGRILREFNQGYNLVKKRIFRVCILIAVLFIIPIFKSMRRYWIETLYIVGFFLGYGILYGWMEIIRAGPRLMLSLFPGLVFMLIAFLNTFANQVKIPRFNWTIPMRPIVYGIITIYSFIAVYHIIGKGDQSAAWLFEGGG